VATERQIRFDLRPIAHDACRHYRAARSCSGVFVHGMTAQSRNHALRSPGQLDVAPMTIEVRES